MAVPDHGASPQGHVFDADLRFRCARFGRIEAHEAVTAWGLETLLRAKEITVT